MHIFALYKLVVNFLFKKKLVSLLLCVQNIFISRGVFIIMTGNVFIFEERKGSV